jgi:Protein of unknown function (DUF3551)
LPNLAARLVAGHVLAQERAEAIFCGGISSSRKSKKGKKMKPTSMKLTTAAAAITSLFFVMSAPSAYAEDYCITSGAQAGHGCGYPSMETCRAAAAGISGTCSQAAGSSTTTPNNANAMAQSKRQSRHATTNPNQPASQ